MKKVLTSNEIFQARCLMEGARSLKDTAFLIGTTQATIRRYLPEMAEQAVMANKVVKSGTKGARKYTTKAQLIGLLKAGGLPTAGLDAAPMETIQQLFRKATAGARNAG